MRERSPCYLRSCSLLGALAALGLFGAGACDSGLAAEQQPAGGDAGSDNAGASGSLSDAGANGNNPAGGATNAGSGNALNDSGTGGADGGSSDGMSGAAGERACGAIPAPNAWASWVMPNPPPSGVPNPASYTPSVSGNQVSDNVTGLVWERNVDSQLFTWNEAKQYCGCLTIDGLADWRLPSRIELASLVDWTTASPSIDSDAFPATTSENFWTSSLVTTDPGLVYLVYFLNGHTTYSDMDYRYRARCVRSSKAAPAVRYRIANSTVYDTQTKLTWQQAIPKSLYAWADAKTYCSALSLDGSGWRLPSINELQTLVDESTNPAID